MGKVKYFIFIVFIFLPFLSSSQKTQAADTDVVINEVIANPEAGGKEWIELYNPSNFDLTLINYTIEDGSQTTKSLDACSIAANSYLVLEKGSGSCNFGFVLNNDGDVIILKRAGLEIDRVTYGNLSGNAPIPPIGQSIARFPNGQDTDNDVEDFMIPINPTPGTENPSPPENIAPTDFNLITPENDLNIFKGQEIEFSWQPSIDPEGQDVTYDFYLSCLSNISDEKLVDSIIPDTNYFLGTDNIIEGYGVCSKYYWKIVASDGVLETTSSIFSFTISEPVYSNAIIINELYPDPGAGEEWVELFNNSAEDVNLKNWILEDLKGSIHQYKISDDLIVPGFGYLIVYKSQSGITLNNDEDGIRLIRPDNIVLSETPIFSDGQKGWSFARDSGGVWQWTTTPTAEKINVMTAMVVADEESDSTQEENFPINSTPVEIKTGEIQNYENYLVKITGVVVETSGNTFYIDDGSGQAKVYIQESTGIDKPPMHRGDIFEIMGIIDLYRGVWRVLPQRKEDIKLIKAISAQNDEEAKSSVAKATSAKSSTAKKSTAAVTKARSPTTQKVAGTNSQDMQTKIQSYRSSFWIQMTKAVSGLSVILLILLIVKIVQVKRESPFINKPLGGDFGDDT